MAKNDPRELYNRATGKEEGTTPVLHVRYEGRSRDIALDILHITAGSPDGQIIEAVAQFLEVGIGQLQGMVIERHANGNLTLRPEALFG